MATAFRIIEKLYGLPDTISQKGEDDEYRNCLIVLNYHLYGILNHYPLNLNYLKSDPLRRPKKEVI